MTPVPTYSASITLLTPNHKFFRTLTKHIDMFGEDAQEKQNAWGYTLESPPQKGYPLARIAKMIGSLRERYDEFNLSQETPIEQPLYQGHVHIWEDRQFRAFLKPKSGQGFPRMIPERICYETVGNMRYLAQFLESGTNGTQHRGFALEFDSLTIEMWPRDIVNFLGNEKEVGRVIRYFQQRYG